MLFVDDSTYLGDADRFDNNVDQSYDQGQQQGERQGW